LDTVGPIVKPHVRDPCDRDATGRLLSSRRPTSEETVDPGPGGDHPGATVFNR
jgi:hypothetical protein